MMQSVDRSQVSAQEEIKKISLWVAVASILQISESLLPHPIPGIRFGFANIISLIVLVNYGFRVALKVALLRTVVSSLILGNFMSPGFILSFSGSLFSMLVVGFLYFISTRNKIVSFGLIGLSVAGAFVHNMTQLCLAYVLIIHHRGIFALIPWLSLGALLMGLVSGVLSIRIVRKLMDETDHPIHAAHFTESRDIFKNKNHSEGTSFVHRLKAEYKLAAIISMTLIIAFISNPLVYLGLIMCMTLLFTLCRVSLKLMLFRIKKIWVILLSSFLLPLVFNYESGTPVDLYLFTVTDTSLLLGSVFVLRLIVLFMAASFMSQTSSIGQITSGLTKIMSPVRVFGADPAKSAEIISLSFHAIPELWIELRGVMKSLMKGKKKSMKNIMEALTNFLVYIFHSRKL